MTTDPAGIITDVNKQMEALTGCTRDELIGAPFKNYFTDPERAEAGIKQMLREKKLTNYELTARARDGKTTVVSYNATTFYDRDRKLQGVFAAARDVTEPKRLDQALKEQNLELKRARSAAEKANLAKSDFLSSMSHELRSPLNAILGFADILMTEVDGPLSAEAREEVEQIRGSGAHLLDLINDILELSALESGQLRLTRTRVDLAAVARDVVREAAGLVGARPVAVHVRGETGIYARADAKRVRQVLTNLVGNAIKFTQEGEVVVDVGRDGRFARMSVSDTGPGISPQERAVIFEEYKQTKEERVRRRGTGLGLAITRRLVLMQKGVIGVQSELGRGSTFEVLLPAWEDAGASQPPVAGGGTA